MKFDGASFFASVPSLSGITASGLDYAKVVDEIKSRTFEAIRQIIERGELAPFPMLWVPAEEMVRRRTKGE